MPSRNSLKPISMKESQFVATAPVRKPRFGSPKRRNFESEVDENMTWTQARKTNELTKINIDINRSHNHSQIDPNPVIYNLESILLLQWSSRVVPRCQNGLPRYSQGGKMASQGAPEVPKWGPKM